MSTVMLVGEFIVGDQYGLIAMETEMDTTGITKQVVFDPDNKAVIDKAKSVAEAINHHKLNIEFIGIVIPKDTGKVSYLKFKRRSSFWESLLCLLKEFWRNVKDGPEIKEA